MAATIGSLGRQVHDQVPLGTCVSGGVRERLVEHRLPAQVALREGDPLIIVQGGVVLREVLHLRVLLVNDFHVEESGGKGRGGGGRCC